MRQLILLFFCCFAISTSIAQQTPFTETYDLLANESYEEAITNATQLTNNLTGDELGECYFIIGYSHKQLNQMGLAMKNYLLALKHYRSPGKISNINNNIGNLLLSLDLHNYAVLYFDAVIQPTVKDSLAINYAYFNRAKALSQLKQYPEALSDIDAAIQLAEFRKDWQLGLQITNRAGLLHRESGNSKASLSFYKQLINKYKELDQASVLYSEYQYYAGMAFHNTAFLHLTEGDTAIALEAYQEALSLAQDGYEIFETSKDMGEIALLQGDQPMALQYLEKAINAVAPQELMGSTSDLEIYQLYAAVVTDVNQKVALLQQGNEQLLAYGKMKDEVIQMHQRHMTVMAMNADREINWWQERFAGLGNGFLLFLMAVLGAGAIALLLLYRRNKQLGRDLQTIISKLSPPEGGSS